MKRPRASSRWSAVVLAAWAAAACGPRQIAHATGGQVWIDAPLHGDHIPEAPYDVLSHANLAAGVANFELSVNGQIVRTDTVEPDQVGQSLAYVTQLWEPAAPGVYFLQVRAADVSGTFGPMAEIQVTVGEPTHTPTPEAAPSTSTPMPAALVLSDPEFSTDTFYYSRAAAVARTCGDEQVTVMTMASDPRITSVVLFFRLAQVDGPGRTEWSGEAMNPQGGGGYSRVLGPEDIPGYSDFGESHLQVQIVATDSDGAEVGRTEVFAEVRLLQC